MDKSLTMNKNNLPEHPTPPAPVAGDASARMRGLASDSGLRPLRLARRELLPVVQGGMGVCVSAGGLAGTVAQLGAVGTISSVDLRRLHPDLMARTGHLNKESDAKAQIDAANLEALDREIRRARTLSQGRGLIAVNIMKALGAYEAYVRQALESGADALVVGAGLPLDLPELARDHPATALIPILSDARGIALLVRKWEKKGRLPDAIVIEHPRLAGGHLGAARVADLQDARFEFETVIPQVLAFFKSAGIEREIPLIAAGGINSQADLLRLQALGAAAVQLGTAFAVTRECDAHPEFKRVLARGQARRPGGVHQRGRSAGARRAHALAGQVPAARAAPEGRGPCEGQVQHVLRLPVALRAARWRRRDGPVLHRPATRPCL
jgi:nitronate monooxygenase